MMDFKNIIGFDWDEFNQNKNLLKHKVHWAECEEIFFNQPLLLYPDIKHSDYEKRFYVLGKTDNFRHLFIVFTIRNDKIRIISARDMNKKELMNYEENS